MCGRLNLTASGAELADAFGLDGAPSLAPRYNIAPSQPIPAVRLDPQLRRRRFGLLTWGLVPSWAKDPAVGNKLINARAESAASKASFKEAFRQRRCLVCTTGFYEWQKRGAQKQPYVIRRKDGRPFAFAGLWESWRGSEAGDRLETCTIVTTEPNELVRPIHDRMPAILPAEAYDLWLDPRVEDLAALRRLLGPAPEEGLEAVPISSLVNSPDNDSPEVLAPVSGAVPQPRQGSLWG